MMVYEGNDGDESEEDDEVISVQALQRSDGGLGGRGGDGAAASETGDGFSLVRSAVQGWEGASANGSVKRRSGNEGGRNGLLDSDPLSPGQ
mmetsp:Transcript_23445/g.69451  ORF Transcript_23445/g.69451 Transcript_23445/m.69451 type:complete len:91 (-) Transcript_23445:3749-4021(-)